MAGDFSWSKKDGQIMWKFLYKWNNNNKMDRLCENFYISEITIIRWTDCKIWMFSMWYFPDLKKIRKLLKMWKFLYKWNKQLDNQYESFLDAGDIAKRRG